MLRKCQLLILLCGLVHLPAMAQVGAAIEWKKYIGGSKEDVANDILLTTDGGFIIAGTTKSNDGEVSGHHGSTDSADAWVAKLDASGNLLWQRSIGGSNADGFTRIIATADHGFLCIGYSNSTDGDLSLNYGSTDCWVVKLTQDGTIVWSNNYGGSMADRAVNAIAMSDGNYAVIGTSYSYDQDVQSGLFGRSDSDGWLFKLDGSGNLLWETCLDYRDSSLDDQGVGIVEMDDHNLVALATGFSRQYYFYEPGYIVELRSTPGVLYSINSQNGTATYTDVIDGDADFSMRKVAGGIYFSFTDKTELPPPMNCTDEYFKTCFRSDGDGQKTYRTFYHYSCTFGSGQIPHPAAITGMDLVAYTKPVIAGYTPTNIGSTGYLLDAYGGETMVGNGYDHQVLNAVRVLPGEQDFIAVGKSDSTGNYNCMIVKFGAVNTITGNVFLDLNNNNLKDTGEPPFRNVTIRSERPGLQVATTPQANGYFLNAVDIGTFTSTVDLHNRPYYSVTPASKTSVFGQMRSADSVDFAVHRMPGVIDYSVKIVPASGVRPGFLSNYRIIYSNRGTNTAGRQIRLIKDSRVSIDQPNPAPSLISGDTLYWDLQDVEPDSSGIIDLSVTAATIPILNINDTLHYIVSIDTTGDYAPGDNLSVLQQLVTGSYDPNDKRENGGGFVNQAEIATGKDLVYTIRFQNTGTDTAFNITVRDTLTSNLEATGLQMLAASHPYRLKSVDGKYISWEFLNINLPDSNRDEPASHGFITYTIKAAGNSATGDTIRNSASIFFDFNPPVLTNTDITVVKEWPTLTWTGAADDTWENKMNWDGHSLPVATTRVIIPANTPHQPVLRSNAICYQVKLDATAVFTIAAGYQLTVTGK